MRCATCALARYITAVPRNFYGANGWRCTVFRAGSGPAGYFGSRAYSLLMWTLEAHNPPAPLGALGDRAGGSPVAEKKWRHRSGVVYR